MTGFDASPLVGERLRALYERHRVCDETAVDRYYASGRGYYPPEEAGEEREVFGIAVMTVDGELHAAGDHDLPFPLYSISKVFAYAMALTDNPLDLVMRRVGVEPSGETYSSIVFDRYHRPHNPMVNAGALVTSNLVRGDDPDRKAERIIQLMRDYAADDGLDVDPRTLLREERTADRNRGTAYLMRAEGILSGDVEAVLGIYLRQCSVLVSCAQLATMGATLANGSVNPVTGERVLSRSHTRDVLSVMYTCGMYDAAGTWAFDVGVPAKSGVGGGILAVVPGKLGIAVYSPGLDVYGNSVRGVAVCRDAASAFGMHLFSTAEEDAILGPAEPAPPAQAAAIPPSEPPDPAPSEDEVSS